MRFPVSTFAALCVLFDLSAATRQDNDLEIVFRDRSHNDWKENWHRERYSRCRETLVRHLYWACEKDIYRLTRRNERENYASREKKSNVLFSYPWMSPQEAHQMLRFRRGNERRAGSSITSECCSSSGCTWEEYAEYCPTNKRLTRFQ